VAGIGRAAEVNGVLNGAITRVKEGGNYNRLKRGVLLRGPDRWGLSMAQEEGSAAAMAWWCVGRRWCSAGWATWAERLNMSVGQLG
jgi:hypothetical protein